MSTATETMMRMRAADITLERLARQRRAYLDAIQPLLAMRARIYSAFLPTFTVYPDGRVESEYVFSDEARAALDLLDQQMKLIARQFELAP